MWQPKATAFLAALLLTAAEPSLCHQQQQQQQQLPIPLPDCPSGKAPEQLSTTGGSTFAICEQANYRGATIQLLTGIATLSDCAAACEGQAGCTRAVFDGVTLECYLKASCKMKMVAADSTRFTTIRKLRGGSSGTVPPTVPGQPPSSTLPGPVESGAPVESKPPVQSKPPVESNPPMETNLPTEPSPTPTPTPSPAPEPPVEADPVSKLGQWSAPIEFPIIPVAAYVVPSSPVSTKMLMFSSWGAREFGGASGKTQFAEYDITTGAVSQRTITNTHHDMFCPGISALSDGRIVISGGSDAAAVSIYDPVADAFTKAAEMVIPRGYQTSATLSDGRVFTIGGSYAGARGGKTGEVYDPATNTWTLLPGTDPKPLLTLDHEGIWREDNHAWLYSWRNGSVFQAGPSRAMNWFLTEGEGTHVPAGQRPSSTDQMCGINVMYDVGKILSAGGAQDYTDSMASKEAHVITIGETGREADAVKTADMHYARGFANAVVLPDGQVIVTGGQKKSLVFTDTDSVLEPEVWSPQSQEWTRLAPAKVPRNYHSVSLLLPDGRVFVGGGGMCYGQKGCDLAKDHLDGEIFSPPYLFARDGTPAARPVIKDVSTTGEVFVGATVEVTLEAEAADVSFVLVRMGSATHSINSDQRRVPVTDSQVAGPGKYSVTIPNDSGVVLPGPWYLFAMSAGGVPSVARTVMVAAS